MFDTFGKNRPSPDNEDEYRYAYKKLNPRAERKDTLDIACVVSITGILGHGLMEQSPNRAKDDDWHRVYDFIPDTEIRKVM